MKKLISSFIYLFISNCCAQGYNLYDLDLIVIQKTNDVHYVDLTTESFKDLIYEDDTYAVALRGKPFPYEIPPSKYFILKKGEENMEVKCIGCGNANYYFKNVVFQEGKYVLKFTFPEKYYEKEKIYGRPTKFVYGRDIHTSNKVQEYFFTNYLYRTEDGYERKVIYFKDLPFIEIDLNDNIHTQLTEVEDF